MSMKELDWRAIEQVVFEMRRCGAHRVLEINDVKRLREMENAIYQLWSRFKRVVEMKELIEHEMSSIKPFTMNVEEDEEE